MIHLEDGEQQVVMEWARLTRLPAHPKVTVADLLFAIPNGGRRGIKEAQRFKRQGVKPGVSDLFFPYPCGHSAGLWIEMKKCRKDFRSDREAEKSVSIEQLDWLVLMEWAGYMGIVAYGASEAIAAIERYLEEEEYVKPH